MSIQFVETVTVGASAVTSITFANIPQTGTHLLFTVSLKTPNSTQFEEKVLIEFNNVETTTGYSASVLNNNSWSVDTTNPNVCGRVGNAFTDGTYGEGDLYITNYTESRIKAWYGAISPSDDASFNTFYQVVGAYNNTAPITQVKFIREIGDFLQNSTISLYTVTAE